MRRVVGVTVVLILASAIGFWLWSRTPVTVPQPRTPLDEPRPISRESKWNTPIAPRGERKISGVVTRAGKPVEGATVTALSTVGIEVLGKQKCACDDSCDGDELLTSRTCPEFEAQLADWIASRAGEGVPMARTTTDSGGAFVLQGLDDSPVTVWADASDGVAFREGITRDVTSELKLELESGRFIEGAVKRFDTQSPKGVLITAVAFDRPRFFEAVLSDDGVFRLGPVPPGEYVVVAMSEELIPGVDTISKERGRRLEFELAPPRSISGVVLDGDPVAGAKVRLTGMHHRRTVTSGADGAFTFKRLRPGRFELYAQAQDAIANEQAQLGSSEDLRGVTLELTRGEAFSGAVVDGKGAPIPEAQVSVYDGAEWHRVKTDPAGHFGFEVLPPGERSFTARKRGYLDASLDTAESNVTLTLKQATHISGRVESAPGVLLPEFGISAQTLDGDDGPDDDFQGSSDWFQSKDGTFSLDVRPGKFSLRVDADGWAQATVEVTAPSSDVVITVKRGIRLTGKVVDLDGVPVKGASVNIDQPPGRTETDADGHFTLEGLAPGEARVFALPESDARAPAWVAQKNIVLREGETLDVTLAPARGVAFAGTVVDEKGQPVAKAEVHAFSLADESPKSDTPPERSFGGATTDDAGHFVIRTLLAGKANVSAMSENSRVSKTVTLPNDRVVLTLKRDTTISGRVVDDTGLPIKAFKVDGRAFDTLDGKFETRTMKGKHDVVLEASGFAARTLSFTLKDGLNEVGDLKLSSGRAVSGVVLDMVTRAPVVGAMVEARSSEKTEDDEMAESGVKTDTLGRFKLSRVDPTATRLVASQSDYLTASVPLTPSASKQDISLKRGASIVARVLDAKGAPYSRGRITATQGKAWKGFLPQPDGTQSAKGLAAGNWVVVVRAEKDRMWRPVQVAVTDGPVNVELREAVDGITVRVTCEGASGMALVFGDKTGVTDLQQLMDEWNLIEVHDGAAQHVSAGRWTLFAVRAAETRSKMEVSSQLVDVPASGELNLVHTPKWRVLNGAPLFRSDDDPIDE